jgi:hypothetical protein
MCPNNVMYVIWGMQLFLFKGSMKNCNRNKELLEEEVYDEMGPSYERFEVFTVVTNSITDQAGLYNNICCPNK